MALLMDEEARMFTYVACQGRLCEADHVSCCHNEQDGVVHKGCQVGQVALVRQALQEVQPIVQTTILR